MSEVDTLYSHNLFHLKGHIWVHFAHRRTATLNSNFTILLSSTVKELFEPIVLQKKRRQVFALFKKHFLEKPIFE